MCENCNGRHVIGRRSLMAMALSGAAAALGPRRAEAGMGQVASDLTPDQALERLKTGNARYIADRDVCVRDIAAGRAAVSESQAPFATILSCADSRVMPQLLFGGVALGELFVARNAGNTADGLTIGSIEYGAAVLGVPLVVVLGHERCGAVVAACDAVVRGTKYEGSIPTVVRPILAAAKWAVRRPGDLVDNTMRENARRVARKIATQSPIVSRLVAAGKVKVVAASYDLDIGRVTFLS